MRFSSRCLALDDEVQKSLKLQGHLQNHAAECIGVGVKAWLASRNVPDEELEYDGGQRWKKAVWVAKILQMNAVISTQRITPGECHLVNFPPERPTLPAPFWCCCTRVRCGRHLTLRPSQKMW